MPKAKSAFKKQITPIGTTGRWCKRCKEREAAPNPRIPLLNSLHEKFCQNVALLGMTNAEAYKKSGSTSKNKSTQSAAGTKLRKKLEVENRITVLMERTIERRLKARDWVDGRLEEVVNRCMQKVPVLEAEGKKVPRCKECKGHRGEWKFDARGANTALQLMGKDRGMFVDKVQIVDNELAGKSPEEIDEIVMAMGVELGRDFVRRMAEKVGLLTADTLTTTPAPTVPAPASVQ